MRVIIFLFLLIVGSYSLEYKLDGQWFNSKDSNHSILRYTLVKEISEYKINNWEMEYKCKSSGNEYAWLAPWQKTCDDFKNYDFICELDTKFYEYYCHFDGSSNMEIIMITGYEVIYNKIGRFVDINTISIKYCYSPIKGWFYIFLVYCFKLPFLCIEPIIFYKLENKPIVSGTSIFNNYYVFIFWVILNLIEFAFYYFTMMITVVIFGANKWADISIFIISLFLLFPIFPLVRIIFVKYFNKIIFARNQYYVIVNQI
jgi:hypothetical protein